MVISVKDQTEKLSFRLQFHNYDELGIVNTNFFYNLAFSTFYVNDGNTKGCNYKLKEKKFPEVNPFIGS